MSKKETNYMRYDMIKLVSNNEK